jgi:hypothetical protein
MIFGLGSIKDIATFERSQAGGRVIGQKKRPVYACGKGAKPGVNVFRKIAYTTPLATFL